MPTQVSSAGEAMNYKDTASANELTLAMPYRWAVFETRQQINDPSWRIPYKRLRPIYASHPSSNPLPSSNDKHLEAYLHTVPMFKVLTFCSLSWRAKRERKLRAEIYSYWEKFFSAPSAPAWLPVYAVLSLGSGMHPKQPRMPVVHPINSWTATVHPVHVHV